jgi:hypothetical protein
MKIETCRGEIVELDDATTDRGVAGIHTGASLPVSDAATVIGSGADTDRRRGPECA